MLGSNLCLRPVCRPLGSSRLETLCELKTQAWRRESSLPFLLSPGWLKNLYPRPVSQPLDSNRLETLCEQNTQAWRRESALPFLLSLQTAQKSISSAGLADRTFQTGLRLNVYKGPSLGERAPQLLVKLYSSTRKLIVFNDRYRPGILLLVSNCCLQGLYRDNQTDMYPFDLHNCEMLSQFATVRQERYLSFHFQFRLDMLENVLGTRTNHPRQREPDTGTWFYSQILHDSSLFTLLLCRSITQKACLLIRLQPRSCEIFYNSLRHNQIINHRFSTIS